MRLRLQGVVAALSRVRERLRAGVPEGERAFFLDEVAAAVREIEETCAGYDATPGDLPAPSRNAYLELRRISTTPPEDLPLPMGGGGEETSPVSPSPKLRIRNVVGTLNRTLEALAFADPGSTTVAAAADAARDCVEDVETICSEESTSPSTLPDRSANAYALLKWLLQDGNLDRYLDRRDAALAAVRQAIDELDPNDDVAREIAEHDPVLVVRFEPGRHVYRLNGRGRRLYLRLGVGFLAADDEDLDAAARVVFLRRNVRNDVRARHRAFVDSEDFGALQQELETLLGGGRYRPRGRVYDLDRLFDRLNETFFDGALARPHLDWHQGRSRSRLGFYVAARDLVCVDVRLDDEEVPEFVAEFVLYHELLHKKHGAELRGRRRHVHTVAFRADERCHPRQAEAEIWLDRLAGGARPS